jgi:hypothetical protein
MAAAAAGGLPSLDHNRVRPRHPGAIAGVLLTQPRPLVSPMALPLSGVPTAQIASTALLSPVGSLRNSAAVSIVPFLPSLERVRWSHSFH